MLSIVARLHFLLVYQCPLGFVDSNTCWKSLVVVVLDPLLFRLVVFILSLFTPIYIRIHGEQGTGLVQGGFIISSFGQSLGYLSKRKSYQSMCFHS